MYVILYNICVRALACVWYAVVEICRYKQQMCEIHIGAAVAIYYNHIGTASRT